MCVCVCFWLELHLCIAESVCVFVSVGDPVVSEAKWPSLSSQSGCVATGLCVCMSMCMFVCECTCLCVCDYVHTVAVELRSAPPWPCKCGRWDQCTHSHKSTHPRPHPHEHNLSLSLALSLHQVGRPQTLPQLRSMHLTPSEAREGPGLAPGLNLL